MTFKGTLAATLSDSSAAVASPSGLAVGKTRFTILSADGSVVVTEDADGLSYDFTGLTDAPVTGTVQLLDTAGSPILDVLTAAFVDADAPVSVTVTPLASLKATYVTE